MKHVCFVLSLFLFHSTFTLSQWSPANGPYGGFVSAIGVNPNAVGGPAIFVGTLGGGIFRSTNNGASWTSVSNGLTFFGSYAATNAFAVRGTSTFAGTTSGVYITTDNGATWIERNVGLTNTAVNALFINGTDIYAGTLGGAFRTTNDGISWSPVNTGLTNTTVSSFAAIGGNMFAGTQGGGVFRSTNNGANWLPANTGLTDLNVRGLTSSGLALIAGTFGGIFRTLDGGGDWDNVDDALATSFLVNAPNIYASGIDLSVSTDNGATWNSSSTGINGSTVVALAANGSTLFAGSATYVATLYVSTNAGASWAKSDAGISAGNIKALISRPNGNGGYDLYAGTNETGVFRSTNSGNDWFSVNDGMTNASVHSFGILNNTIFAGAGFGVYGTTNNGASWSSMSSGLPFIVTVSAFTTRDTNIFAGTSNGVYFSPNGGLNWTQRSSGITIPGIRAMATFGSNVYAAGNGIYVSTNDGISWTPTGSGITSNSIVAITQLGTDLFVGTQNGVFRSTDNGVNWNAANTGMTTTSMYSLITVGSDLIAGMVSGMYISTNRGDNWTAINTGFPSFFGLINPSVQSVLCVPGSGGAKDVFAGTFLLGLWRRPLSQITDVRMTSSEIPVGFSLSQNYPNPFNPKTIIGFTIGTYSPASPAGGHTSLRIFDLLGKEIATLVHERLMPGTYSAEFDASGLPSGVYYYRLEAGNFSETKSLMLLR